MKSRTSGIERWVMWAMVSVGLLGSGFHIAAAGEDVSTRLDSFLQKGEIEAGLQHFAGADKNQDLFALGMLQALDGLQTFSVGLNRFAYRQDGMLGDMPFFRFGGRGTAVVEFEKVTPEKVGALFRDLRAALRTANATLGRMDEEEFKVQVNLSQLRFDINGDGVVAPEETLVSLLGPALGIPPTNRDGEDVVVRFDLADGAWLKGYTHVMTGILEVLLTYDWSPLWTYAAPVMFQNYAPVAPMAEVAMPDAPMGMGSWLDAIALVHAIQLDVADPEGLRRAQAEFQGMIACSRKSWTRILAETDDDMEWIPSPTQTGPGGVRIRQEELDGWLAVLDELEAVLKGDALVPHVRMRPDWGIHIPSVVDHPPRLDLVMLARLSLFGAENDFFEGFECVFSLVFKVSTSDLACGADPPH